MLRNINTTLILIFGLVMFGFSLQLEYGPRANTVIMLLDVILNILVIVFGIVQIRVGSPLQLVFGYLVYRSLVNIAPLSKIILQSLISKPSEDVVAEVCHRAKEDYNIIWDRKPQPRPCIYLANHALWCMDDIVAIGALSDSNLSVVTISCKSALKAVPIGCRRNLCTIEKGFERGSGFEAMKTILREEVLEKRKSLVVFPENMKLKADVNKMAPLRTGVIKLARELDIPLVPIWITWPCQFPTIVNSTEKVLRIKELQ